MGLVTLVRRQKPVHLIGLAVAVGLVALAAGPVAAMVADPVRKTPDNFSYEIRDGKRVPKAGKRVTNPDGSWREERRDGDCVIVREKTAKGEYRESRQC